jgi:hypothetical protein
MADTPIPPISKALVDWLNRLFPDRCPNVNMSDRDIWIAAGRADVVRKLAHEHNQQATRVLEP